MKSSAFTKLMSQPAVLLGLFVLLLSFLTYFQNYQNPPALFWDENYHIASAQKYLNGIYFMEPHPPLGKLLIALGEKIFHPNVADNQFIGTDYGKELPAGFSFIGYRFFPTLLAWLTAPLLYLILLLILRRPQEATILSFLYIFDNAEIVHSRGAMLDSTLVFFSAVCILAFLLMLEWKKNLRRLLWAAALFGAAFGAVMTTKETGLILILFLPFLLWKLWPDRQAIGKTLGVMAASFLVIFVGVWQTHFALGSTVNPKLPDSGYYQASPEYKQILTDGTNGFIQNFPVMLRDSLFFMGHYAAGVPRLDLCKKDENGSPFYEWPLGARSINYRWETPDSRQYRYLYLQVNPVIWWTSFAAVLIGLVLLVGSVLRPPKEPLEHRFLLTVFLTMYVCYMIAISQLSRVMYLYHYFPPLFFTFLILAVVFLELKGFAKWKFTEEGKQWGLLIFGLLIFAAFHFYRPFTYYQAITDEQFKRRAFFPYWELTCVNCQKESPIVVPTK
ncbi:MAG: phospholipid carrier-dependent glycosyltransferase [Candidatus Peregrinibacteria bacterium]